MAPAGVLTVLLPSLFVASLALVSKPAAFRPRGVFTDVQSNVHAPPRSQHNGAGTASGYRVLNNLVTPRSNCVRRRSTARGRNGALSHYMGPPRIIISGAPASGKGTQCEMIKENYGVIHLSTGDILREAVRDGTPVGLLAKGYMDQGLLVPDGVIIDIVTARLREADCVSCGWLLDGFPRTRAQADALTEAGVAADAFVLLEVPDDDLITRVVGRRLDPETGAIYHVAFSPPPLGAVAERCVQRSDDTEEKARVRLQGYHANIDAVKGCYGAIMCSIDGTAAKAAVFAAIQEQLRRRIGPAATAAAVRGGADGASAGTRPSASAGSVGAARARVAAAVAMGAVVAVPTRPIAGMKPGTSGLRKKVTVWQEGNYLANFVQAIFDSMPPGELAGSTIVVSGDGRYHNPAAIQAILRIAAASGVARAWVGRGGLLSTPAVSAVLRRREGGGVASLGIVLTASHNPGGPDGDFGIKYNTRGGSPATEQQTEAAYRRSLEISEYRMVIGGPDVDLERMGAGTQRVGAMEVEVIDPVEDYVVLLEEVFDFDAIRALLARKDFSFIFDGMNGVAGPYAKRVLVDKLGADPTSLMRCEPSETFGGCHPDPNLTYAPELVRLMGLQEDGSPIPAEAGGTPKPRRRGPAFGAAADGDADRNMILGEQFFVTPSDSLAVIAANADAIPYFAKAGGLGGVARSMPTSGAVDRVAEKKGWPCFETPTGWKFFGNLMDAKEMGHDRSYHPFLCGEESFGTGSDHVREKDGLWAVLAWLSILAARNPDPAAPLVGVGDVVRAHWATYGRNVYCRYDFEGVGSEGAEAMMKHLRAYEVPSGGAEVGSGYKLVAVSDFEYTDPVDGSVSRRQGVRLFFEDGSRVVFRLSGTGSEGATVRVYVEKFEPDVSRHSEPAAASLAPLAEIGLGIARLREFTGREAPTVIT